MDEMAADPCISSDGGLGFGVCVLLNWNFFMQFRVEEFGSLVYESVFECTAGSSSAIYIGPFVGF